MQVVEVFLYIESGQALHKYLDHVQRQALGFCHKFTLSLFFKQLVEDGVAHFPVETLVKTVLFQKQKDLRQNLPFISFEPDEVHEFVDAQIVDAVPLLLQGDEAALHPQQRVF